MKNLMVFTLISLLVLSTGTLFSQKKSDVKPEGTWSFTAPDADYAYNKGDLIIGLEGKEFIGELVFSEYSKVKLQEMKLESNVLSFKAYIEGEVINAKIDITGDEMKGQVSYSGGSIEFSAIRKQK